MWGVQAKWGKRQRDINGTRSKVTTGNTGTGYRAYPLRGGAASQGHLQNGQRNQLGVTKGTCQVLGRNNPVLSSEVGEGDQLESSLAGQGLGKMWTFAGKDLCFPAQPKGR